eukprot:105121-Prymnesium_polylepis.1
MGAAVLGEGAAAGRRRRWWRTCTWWGCWRRAWRLRRAARPCWGRTAIIPGQLFRWDDRSLGDLLEAAVMGEAEPCVGALR